MSEISEGAGSPTFAVQASGTTPADAPDVVTTPMENVQETPTEGMSARTYADKFESVEALEQGYGELAKKLGERVPKIGEMSPDEVVKAAGLDVADIVTNWQASGKLTDAQYTALSRQGYSRSAVDAHMHGQVAIGQNNNYAQEAIQRQAHELAGGETEYHNLMKWASTNYQDAKKASLDGLLENPTTWQAAIKEMLWDYKVQTGRGFTQPLVDGHVMPNTSTGFNTVAELVAAMGEVRRQGHADEAFKRRLANTSNTIMQGVDH
jgi:hypothetical protein